MKTIFVIGLQPGFALSREAGNRLAGSDVILASPRLYETFVGREAFYLSAADASPLSHRIKVIPKVEDTVSFLRGFKGEASVLASGDPLFFGIGGVLLSEFPPEEVKIYPAVSSVQLAFAKAGKSWEDAFFMSLHGPKKRRWKPEDLPLLASIHPKLAILTGGENRPCEIARFLPEDSKVYVLERLGLPDEKMTVTTASKIKNEGASEIKKAGPSKPDFSEPNLMIVETGGGMTVEMGGGKAEDQKQKQNQKVRFGLEESDFEHYKKSSGTRGGNSSDINGGLITKDEARAVILHKLRLPLEGVLWDIGAGSGSVGIEAKRLSPNLDVYMVERDPERLAQAYRNAVRSQAGGITMVQGEAPEALAGLPAPDRVFIGGSGGRLADTIKFASGAIRAGGIIVVSAVTLESIGEALSLFSKEGFCSVDAVSVAASRMEPVGKPRENDGRKDQKNYLKALNPVFIIRARF